MILINFLIIFSETRIFEKEYYSHKNNIENVELISNNKIKILFNKEINFHGLNLINFKNIINYKGFIENLESKYIDIMNKKSIHITYDSFNEGNYFYYRVFYDNNDKYYYSDTVNLIYYNKKIDYFENIKNKYESKVLLNNDNLLELKIKESKNKKNDSKSDDGSGKSNSPDISGNDSSNFSNILKNKDLENKIEKENLDNYLYEYFLINLNILLINIKINYKYLFEFYQNIDIIITIKKLILMLIFIFIIFNILKIILNTNKKFNKKKESLKSIF